MSSFPTDEGLIFILCDDFRHEGNGKISMFGVYGDTLIVEQPLEQKKVTLPSLGMYIAFRDGVGHFQMSIGLTDGENKILIPEGKSQSVEKKVGGWMNVALKLMPFEGALGEYKLKVSLTDENGALREYTRTFSINRQVISAKH